MDSVKITTITSLIFQLMIGIICVRGLFYDVEKENNILRELLLIETLVQVIEFAFYLYIFRMIYTNNLLNVTSIRYFDWFITTPTMLLSLIIYISYKNNKTITDVKSFIKKHTNDILYIIGCNAAMLIFGYLGETGVIDLYYASIIGFVFFFASFYRIYDKFVRDTEMFTEFMIVFGIWSIYGIAALFEPVLKNNMYNILDIFSKNIMGIFLFYQLYLIKK
mgnify:CR=1 FL=1